MTNRTIAIGFENVFLRLLSREKVALDNLDVSLMFEIIATNLFCESSNRKGQYFDGAVGLISSVKSPRKVEFRGEMWIGGNRTQWTEPLRATVTDKRTTKQGIWIIVTVGSDRAEGELMSAFGIEEGAEPGASPNAGCAKAPSASVN